VPSSAGAPAASRPIYIYFLKCEATGKGYVGQTVDMKARWRQHKAKPPPLWQKDAAAMASPFTPETCPMKDVAVAATKQQANVLEAQYQLMLKTMHPHGYNDALGDPATSRSHQWVHRRQWQQGKR
jgi:predicted GIY-YIG superfamily endonuclease